MEALLGRALAAGYVPAQKVEGLGVMLGDTVQVEQQTRSEYLMQILADLSRFRAAVNKVSAIACSSLSLTC